MAGPLEFKLRNWEPGDLDDLVEQADNANIARFTSDAFPHPYTRDDGIRFIDGVSKASPITVFAIECAGKVVGGIGIHPQTDIMRKNAELGFWLGESFWGKGIMTAAVMQMTDFGFKTLDINRIYARVFGCNLASQRVLKKTGFELESNIAGIVFKNGNYHDELVFGIRKPHRDQEKG